MQEIDDGKSGNSPERAMKVEEAPGGKNKQVRRTRGHAPLEAGGANGQGTNGHAAPVAERDRTGVNGHGKHSGPNGHAASDDASGAPVALAAHSPAAGTDPKACADAAEPFTITLPQANASTAAGPRVTGEENEIPPGSEALPEDGISFVDAMHERIDLWEVGRKLMQNEDPKIAQRAWERLLEMKYGKGQSVTGDEIPQIIFDTPPAVRE